MLFIYKIYIKSLSNVVCFVLQRSSISPAEREKYRPRTPQEPEHKKPKKEEKDIGHVSIKVRI